MSKRTRLLASVAMPLISISLIAPTALAAPVMPMAGGASQAGSLPIVRVQQTIVVPPSADQAPAEETEPAQTPAEPEAKPEATEPKASEPAAEAPAAEAPAAEAPSSQSAPADAPAASQVTPEPEPEAPSKPAEEPKAEAPAAEAPAAEEPKTEAPKTEAPAAEAPATEAPATREAAPEAPKTEAPAADAPAAETPAAPAAPSEAPATSQTPAAQEPATAAPEPATPAAPTPAAPTPASPAPAAPDASSPAAPGTAPAAPLPSADGGQRAEQPAAPRTEAEIEAAKKIAADPASSNQTVVLPVENGAAVLDSAKEGAAPAAATTQAAPGAPRDGSRASRRDGQPAGAPATAAAPTTPPAPPPTSDAEAQAAVGGQRSAPVQIEPSIRERGERLSERPRYERPRGFDNGRESDDGRLIIQLDNRTTVRHDDSRRFYAQDYEPEYERLRDGRTREIIERDGGVRIVTIRDRYGDIVQRSRIGEDGREYVLYYSPERNQPRGRDYTWRDPALDLPPMRLTIPVDEYIIDTSSEPDRDYYEFLEQPPVERVERVYSLDEVKYSARIRDKVRRIDLDTVTFATGSAEIPMNQAGSLRKVADAIKEVLEKDPSETFLIEGHTDAVGSDESNLVLSDRRAESVAVVLSDAFGIPPENLATQGYGERYLKVRTEAAEQQNRRVTIRRITALVKPVAQNR
ncbi:OmpA family protein [Rhizobium sp. 0TCS1.26]|uniref:OmpA family protein n=1 Tax=Rhizobium sp. 0TCS1.26 TaxID=3142623 RepID=UPI003D2A5099